MLLISDHLPQLATLTGKQWHLFWNSALKYVPDNYEAGVSPVFLEMLLTTPLIYFEISTSWFKESFPPAIFKVQAAQKAQNIPSSKDMWILPVLLQTG